MNKREEKQNELLRGEDGQIVILFTFGVIAFVFLIALIFNTAKMTIRKMEKQGATDSAAVTGGVWMARGMNLMTFNNNGMVETVSVMITVRSTLQTAEFMSEVLPIMAAALAYYAPPLSAELSREASAYQSMANSLKSVDRALSANSSGFGWRVMSALDQLNQSIKVGFPALAYAKSIELAKANGADKAPYNLMLAGMPSSGLPMFPVARGPQRILIDESKCVLPKLKIPIYPVLFFTGPVSSPMAIGVFEAMVICNKSALTGGSGFCRYIPGITGPLEWPDKPPMPMILTDAPVRQMSATTEKTEPDADFAKARQYLQYLAVSFGQLSKESSIGNRYFENPANRWLTYGQADVFNPSLWSMFRQDWRSQLVQANLFAEKVSTVSQLVGLQAVTGSAKDWAFINVH